VYKHFLYTIIGLVQLCMSDYGAPHGFPSQKEYATRLEELSGYRCVNGNGSEMGRKLALFIDKTNRGIYQGKMYKTVVIIHKLTATSSDSHYRKQQ